MLILFATLVMAISLNSENTSFGLIEIKKHKVINSPKVCGDKLCNEIDEKRSEKGLSTRDIKVCDDRLCSEISETKMTSPMKQYRVGIPLNLIQCPDSMELVLKQSDRKPACVMPETADKLIQQGWALPKEEQVRIISSISEMEQENNAVSDARLSITPEIINGVNYLIFEGSGWHRLHNVEITITNDGEKITSLRSQTTDNGVLHMPWPLPSNLPGGFFQIRATDGIHQNELTIPISGQVPIEFRPILSELEVEVSGEKQVRRGTTHTIEVHVNRDNSPIEGARVNITIEDYGEDIIREFSGYTNQEGYFEFSWEIPQRFDDIETLLAFVDVTDGISSKTELFKFLVYCLPGENNCEVEGN